MVKLPFYADCTSWPPDELAALNLLVDVGREIQRGWFLHNTDALPRFAELLDTRYWGVAYYRLPREPVYWFTHSCIEYVFAEHETIHRINNQLERGERHEATR